MYYWYCEKCEQKVWCSDTCTCGNTIDENRELRKQRELQKEIEREIARLNRLKKLKKDGNVNEG